jgi:hypothetical protein
MDFNAQYGISISPVGLAGNAARVYTDKVREHLTWIYRTKMGRILLASIKFHAKPVIIQPYTGTDCNSSGGWKTVGGAVQGTVSYSPDTFSLHGACSVNKAAANARSGLLWDEILFHELVHVFRGVSGKWNKTSLTGALVQYDDTEEFFAVMITNIYISDRTNRIKTSLRANHNKNFRPQGAKFSEPWGFFTRGPQVFSLVKQFVEENHGFSTRVATDLVDVPFNPIADYYADRYHAEDISRQAATTPAGVWDVIVEMLRTM